MKRGSFDNLMKSAVREKLLDDTLRKLLRIGAIRIGRVLAAEKALAGANKGLLHDRDATGLESGLHLRDGSIVLLGVAAVQSGMRNTALVQRVDELHSNLVSLTALTAKEHDGDVFRHVRGKKGLLYALAFTSNGFCNYFCGALRTDIMYASFHENASFLPSMVCSNDRCGVRHAGHCGKIDTIMHNTPLFVAKQA